MNVNIQSIIELFEDIEAATNEKHTTAAITEVRKQIIALEMQIKAHDLYNDLEIIKEKLQADDKFKIKQVQNFLKNVTEMGVLK